jgi:hypothetical protein
LAANLDNTQFQYERLLGASGFAGDSSEAFSENCAQSRYQLTASKDQKGIDQELKQWLSSYQPAVSLRSVSFPKTS